jgi:HK97 family phage major capsid protein/HK97 family phage prohead protease
MPRLDRAYAILHVKSIADDRRTITGIATTPTLDRQNHSLDPAGVTFKNPLPLLLHHDAERPIGRATFNAPTAEGITFEATLPTIDEPGAVKDRVDAAWQSIKAGLLTGVSIGFRLLPDGLKARKSGGFILAKTEICELSLVTIPANAEASILTIKALDAPHLAALGLHPPGDSGPRPVRIAMNKSLAEQIAAFENSRAAKAAELVALMAKAGEDGTTLDAAQTEKYETLEKEIASIDEHLPRLKKAESLAVKAATPITAGNELEASKQRQAIPIVQISSPLPKGTAFIRYCQAKAMGRGSNADAIDYARQWHDSTPEVELALKAAVPPGTTTDATWAGPLAPMMPLTSEFLELLRPATILGKVPSFFKVPFNVSVASQTGGGTYQWVGQGAPKPVGKLQFGTITLGILKCAGIIVITEELARTSTPSAEEVIRRDMINGIAAFLDTEFIDPTKAAVGGVSPGSVTNGVTPITTAGTTPANARTDIQALANAMTALNLSTAGAVLIMSETNALALTNALNPLGQPLLPGMDQGGGTIMGYKAITSQAAGTTVALVQPNAILYADDGGVSIDVSREASVQMDSAPDNPALATTVLTNFWQNNLVGLRAERFINWKKARAGVVQYTVATYAA